MSQPIVAGDALQKHQESFRRLSSQHNDGDSAAQKSDTKLYAHPSDTVHTEPTNQQRRHKDQQRKARHARMAHARRMSMVLADMEDEAVADAARAATSDVSTAAASAEPEITPGASVYHCPRQYRFRLSAVCRIERQSSRGARCSRRKFSGVTTPNNSNLIEVHSRAQDEFLIGSNHEVERNLHDDAKPEMKMEDERDTNAICNGTQQPLTLQLVRAAIDRHTKSRQSSTTVHILSHHLYQDLQPVETEAAWASAVKTWAAGFARRREKTLLAVSDAIADELELVLVPDSTACASGGGGGGGNYDGDANSSGQYNETAANSQLVSTFTRAQEFLLLNFNHAYLTDRCVGLLLLRAQRLAPTWHQLAGSLATAPRRFPSIIDRNAMTVAKQAAACWGALWTAIGGDMAHGLAVASTAKVETRARFLVGALRCKLQLQHISEQTGTNHTQASPSSSSRPLVLNLDAPGLLAALMNGANSRLARLLPKITRASLQASSVDDMGSWTIPECALMAAEADTNAVGLISALASGIQGVECPSQNAVAKAIAEEGVRLLWDGQPTAVGGAALGAALPDSVSQLDYCSDLATTWQYNGGRRAVLLLLAFTGAGEAISSGVPAVYAVPAGEWIPRVMTSTAAYAAEALHNMLLSRQKAFADAPSAATKASAASDCSTASVLTRIVPAPSHPCALQLLHELLLATCCDNAQASEHGTQYRHNQLRTRSAAAACAALAWGEASIKGELWAAETANHRLRAMALCLASKDTNTSNLSVQTISVEDGDGADQAPAGDVFEAASYALECCLHSLLGHAKGISSSCSSSATNTDAGSPEEPAEEAELRLLWNTVASCAHILRIVACMRAVEAANADTKEAGKINVGCARYMRSVASVAASCRTLTVLVRTLLLAGSWSNNEFMQCPGSNRATDGFKVRRSKLLSHVHPSTLSDCCAAVAALCDMGLSRPRSATPSDSISSAATYRAHAQACCVTFFSFGRCIAGANRRCDWLTCSWPKLKHPDELQVPASGHSILAWLIREPFVCNTRSMTIMLRGCNIENHRGQQAHKLKQWFATRRPAVHLALALVRAATEEDRGYACSLVCAWRSWTQLSTRELNAQSQSPGSAVSPRTLRSEKKPIQDTNCTPQSSPVPLMSLLLAAHGIHGWLLWQARQMWHMLHTWSAAYACGTGHSTSGSQKSDGSNDREARKPSTPNNATDYHTVDDHLMWEQGRGEHAERETLALMEVALNGVHLLFDGIAGTDNAISLQQFDNCNCETHTCCSVVNNMALQSFLRAASSEALQAEQECGGGKSLSRTRSHMNMSGARSATSPCLSACALCPVKISNALHADRHEIRPSKANIAVHINRAADQQFNPGDTDGTAAACDWDPRRPPISWLVSPLTWPTPQLLIPSLKALSSLCCYDCKASSVRCQHDDEDTICSAVQCSSTLLAGKVRRALTAVHVDQNLNVGPELREDKGACDSETDLCDVSDEIASIGIHDTCENGSARALRKQSMLDVACPSIGKGHENENDDGVNELLGEKNIITVLCAWVASVLLFDCDSNRQTSAKKTADTRLDAIQQALGEFVIETNLRQRVPAVAHACNNGEKGKCFVRGSDDGGTICCLLQHILCFLAQLLRAPAHCVQKDVDCSSNHAGHGSESVDDDTGPQLATGAGAPKESALLRTHQFLEAREALLSKKVLLHAGGVDVMLDIFKVSAGCPRYTGCGLRATALEILQQVSARPRSLPAGANAEGHSAAVPSPLSALAFAQDRLRVGKGRVSCVNVDVSRKAQKTALLQQQAVTALHIRKRLVVSGALPILLHALAGDGADIDIGVQDSNGGVCDLHNEDTCEANNLRCTGLSPSSRLHAAWLFHELYAVDVELHRSSSIVREKIAELDAVSVERSMLQFLAFGASASLAKSDEHKDQRCDARARRACVSFAATQIAQFAYHDCHPLGRRTVKTTHGVVGVASVPHPGEVTEGIVRARLIGMGAVELLLNSCAVPGTVGREVFCQNGAVVLSGASQSSNSSTAIDCRLGGAVDEAVVRSLHALANLATSAEAPKRIMRSAAHVQGVCGIHLLIAYCSSSTTPSDVPRDAEPPQTEGDLAREGNWRREAHRLAAAALDCCVQPTKVVMKDALQKQVGQQMRAPPVLPAPHFRLFMPPARPQHTSMQHVEQVAPDIREVLPPSNGAGSSSHCSLLYKTQLKLRAEQCKISEEQDQWQQITFQQAHKHERNQPSHNQQQCSPPRRYKARATQLPKGSVGRARTGGGIHFRYGGNERKPSGGSGNARTCIRTTMHEVHFGSRGSKCESTNMPLPRLQSALCRSLHDTWRFSDGCAQPWALDDNAAAALVACPPSVAGAAFALAASEKEKEAALCCKDQAHVERFREQHGTVLWCQAQASQNAGEEALRRLHQRMRHCRGPGMGPDAVAVASFPHVPGSKCSAHVPCYAITHRAVADQDIHRGTDKATSKSNSSACIEYRHYYVQSSGSGRPIPVPSARLWLPRLSTPQIMPALQPPALPFCTPIPLPVLRPGVQLHSTAFQEPTGNAFASFLSPMPPLPQSAPVLGSWCGVHGIVNVHHHMPLVLEVKMEMSGQ